MDPTAGLNLVLLMVSVLAAGGSALLAMRRRPGVPLDLTAGESLYLSAVVGAVAASWLGLTLAELGRFSLPALMGLLLVFALVLQLYHFFQFGHGRRHRGAPPWSPSPSHLAASLRFRLSPTRHDLLLLATLALAIALFFRPHEFVLGGRDPGAYVNTGATIARTGAILVRDPMVPALTPEERGFLFADTPVPWIRSGWPGYQMLNFHEGIVEPHGLHLFPVWLAALGAAGGVEISLFAMPVLGLLSVASAYFLGRRLFGRGVGLLAAFLLTINVAEVWYARYPAAEMLVQFLGLAGLYVFVLMLQTHRLGLAVLAGVSFGLVHLAKIDAIAVVVALALYVGYESLTGSFRREYAVLLATFGLLLGQTVAHAALIAPAYALAQVMAAIPGIDPGAFDRADANHPFTASFAIDFLRSNVRQAATLAAAGALLLTLVVAGHGRLKGAPAFLRRHRRRLSVGLAVFVIGLALYAYFVRPLGGPVSPPGTMAAAIELSDRRSLVWLGWYLSPLGLALAIAGFLHLAATTRDRAVALFLLMAMAGTVPFLFRTLVAPDHFWAARRLLAVGVPAFVLLASYTILRIPLPPWSVMLSRSEASPRHEQGPPGRCFAAAQHDKARVAQHDKARAAAVQHDESLSWRLGGSTSPESALPLDTLPAGAPRLRFPAALLLRALLIGLLAVLYGRATWPFLGHQEYAGAYRQLALVAAAVPPEAILVLEWPEPAQRLATPLAQLFERDTFALRREHLGDPRLAAFARRWSGFGRTVFWLGAGPVAPAGRQENAAVGFEPAGRYALDLVHAEAPNDRLPTRIERERLDLWLYELPATQTTSLGR
ncbi:MAG: glycosyltransferase family 39 protein [Chloroflexi bacterium]|nr:glycosyltransferase family 39 protein [Chloroflexota bacterium]